VSKVFPEPVTGLPRADVPLEGVTAYLSQGTGHQIVFMEFDRDVEVSAHSHGAQWGIVLEGTIDLTIGGVRRRYVRGDRYFIPAGVEHSAVIYAGYADATFFADPDRHRPK
jgi:quercetin dioxygenase-like cupin family protein